MINQAIQNKLKADELRENGVKTYPMESILGDMKTVKEFAAFGVGHKQDIEVLRSQLLLDYAEGEFSPAEFRAYRLGLDSILLAFQNAEADTKSYLQESEQNKKSVG